MILQVFMSNLSFDERVEIARNHRIKGSRIVKTNCYGCAFFLRGLEDKEKSISSPEGYKRVIKECVELPRIPEKGCFVVTDYFGFGAHIGVVVDDSNKVFDRKQTNGIFRDDVSIESLRDYYESLEVKFFMHPSEIDF